MAYDTLFMNASGSRATWHGIYWKKVRHRFSANRMQLFRVTCVDRKTATANRRALILTLPGQSKLNNRQGPSCEMRTFRN